MHICTIEKARVLIAPSPIYFACKLCRKRNSYGCARCAYADDLDIEIDFLVVVSRIALEYGAKFLSCFPQIRGIAVRLVFLTV